MGDPVGLGNLVWHLDVDLFIVILGFQKAHEVQILLSPLVLEELSEAKDADKLGLNSSFFPDFSNDSLLDRLSVFDKPSWQFPKSPPQPGQRLPLLNAEHLLAIFAHHKASHANVVTCKPRHLVQCVWQPLRHHQVVILGVVEGEAAILNSNPG